MFRNEKEGGVSRGHAFLLKDAAEALQHNSNDHADISSENSCDSVK